jgi:hypothetical protein
MENKFLVELDGCPQYNELWNFKRFSKWFQCKVSMQLQICCNGVKSFIHKRIMHNRP